MTTTHPTPAIGPWQRPIRATDLLACLLGVLAAGGTPATFAQDPAKPIGEQLREAIDAGSTDKKHITLVINGKEKKFITIPYVKPETPPRQPANEPDAKANKDAEPKLAPARKAMPTPSAEPAVVINPQASRQYIRARAAALTGGPQASGKLHPEFSLCVSGKRQSPINIDDTQTLLGPAEPLQFNYHPSHATVRHAGHTIEVDVAGNNSLTVRGSTFKLLQLHFHHPAEERVNNQGFAMAVHLLHRNAEGQIAMLAVLLEPGQANALINKVWTYMPLEKGDQVPMPAGLLDLHELLPQDQRYYQFFGSLTTPPCTEGVLWLIIKQPATASNEQIKLFSQLVPNNARPIQALNGRMVRNAQ